MYAARRAKHRSRSPRCAPTPRTSPAWPRRPASWRTTSTYLKLDLTDAQMHRHFKRQAEAARAFVSATLAEAVVRGELRKDTNGARLTRLVESVIAGALFTWAMHRDGRVAGWMRRRLDDLLASYTPGARRR